MESLYEKLPFRPADILLPRDCDLTKWSVVACDQYTSEPEYWQRVEEFVGGAPSSLRLILPESRLGGGEVEGEIQEINMTMAGYLREGRFTTYPESMIYVERTTRSGAVRRGLVGMVDLEQYNYEPGSATPVRATEGTVLSRIPPRVAVRKNAPIELPHVMLLADDPERTVIEPLARAADHMEKLYDFDLMENSGRLKGWLLGPEELSQVAGALTALADPGTQRARYGTDEVFLIAVGDGNHSLATAKECYERQKRFTPPESWPNLPSRYALAELVNLHDDSLEFEAIHRVVFGTDPEALIDAFAAAYPGGHRGEGEGRVFPVFYGDKETAVTIPGVEDRLAVDVLQSFLDDYTRDHGGETDYIHGESVARELAKQPGATAFLLPAMEKSELFPGVLRGGVLPRKTFSMGEACDKRFYLEARKIR